MSFEKDLKERIKSAVFDFSKHTKVSAEGEEKLEKELYDEVIENLMNPWPDHLEWLCNDRGIK